MNVESMRNGFQNLSIVEKDVVTLCTFSVGILLIAIGLITILSAKRYGSNNEIALNISIINLSLWLVRIIFEIVLPVKIAVLSIKNPTIYAMPVFIALWLIIGVAVVFMWKDKKNIPIS